LSIFEKYQLVVGLEVHAQLSTKSKLFCADDTSFGSPPNTQVSPISLAHPGTLPKLNQKAVELAVKLGIALNCEIESYNYFARKNYFYPDLPKGYQISQHTAPICKGGTVSITSQEGIKNIQLNRIHIEEDAGKSIHDADDNYTLIDLNRAGTPLVEIVTEPMIHSAEDAFLFLTELRKTLRWLDVCDGNMEEGSMRCDANISIRLKGDLTLGKRVEVKNLNSIRNVKRAIDIEFERLVTLTENNESFTQETRSYDADNNSTFSLRTKEDAEDYRYFPEPDLPPFIITQTYIDDIKSNMPALPNQVKSKYINEFGLSDYDASVICSDKDDVFFFESVIKYSQDFKAVANWMLGPLKYYCNENGIGFSAFPISHELIADLITLTSSGKLSFNNASGKVLQVLIANPNQSANEAATALNLIQESNSSELMKWIEQVIIDMPEKVKEYKSGKKGLIGLFSGEVKKRSNGKADMQLVNQLLQEKLNQ
jgi:aspartyl-tRNA(Asn)/glutamyl-tRNA(Gln) amidotransferase subunit B